MNVYMYSQYINQQGMACAKFRRVITSAVEGE